MRKLEKEIQRLYKELADASDKEIQLYAEKLAELENGKNKDEEKQKAKIKKFIISSAVSLALIKKLSKLATNTNVKSARSTYKYMKMAYTTGYNGWVSQFNVKYALDMSLADKKAIEQILKGGKLLPEPRIEIPKNLKWNERRMRSALLQSAVKGEAIPDLSKRLRNAVDMNKVSATRNARTMMMHAHNAGKFEAGQEAISQGIKIAKEWQAHIDSRTRASHIEINGEIVPFDKPFSNGLMYPQDLEGDPSEVYNCRCTLGYVIL